MSTPWRVRLSVGPVPLRGFALLLIGWVGVGLGGNGYAAEETNPLPAIAIIIDDLGNRRPEGVDALSLPGPVTYAILPHTPLARRFADRAFSQGKEVLLHQPMESVHGLALGPGGITGQMDETQVLEVLRDNLASIPYLSGVSNHMGSLLSTREETVEWMMQAIVTSSSPSRLFFVDSRTTSGSVIARVARRSGIPTITRDVFLDNSLDPNEIRAQFHHLVKRAKSREPRLPSVTHTAPPSWCSMPSSGICRLTG